MKLAMMLAGMAAGRRAGGPAGVLGQGTKLLSQSPELARLNQELRGRLVDAGKNAAMAVATRQVESLSDRLGQRVASLADAAAAPTRKAGRGREQSEEPASDVYEDEEYAGDEYESEEPEEYASDEYDEAGAEPEAVQDETQEEPEEEPPPAPRPKSTGSGPGVVKRPVTAAGGVARAATKAVPGRGDGQASGRGGQAPARGGGRPPARTGGEPARARRGDGND